MQYSNLNVLLHNDSEAKHYFETLPDYAREQISSRFNSINSLAGLRDYAQNLLQSDDG